MLRTAARIALAAAKWPVRSQDVARNNALVGCMVLAERRRDLDEAEAFLRRHDGSARPRHDREPALVDRIA